MSTFSVSSFWPSRHLQYIAYCLENDTFTAFLKSKIDSIRSQLYMKSPAIQQHWPIRGFQLRRPTLLALPLTSSPSDGTNTGPALSSVHILVLCHLLDCVQSRLGFPAFSMARPPLVGGLPPVGVSPGPPVGRPQRSDRPAACEITPLSCSHCAPDIQSQWLLQKRRGFWGAGWAKRQLPPAFIGTAWQKMHSGAQLTKNCMFLVFVQKCTSVMFMLVMRLVFSPTSCFRILHRFTRVSFAWILFPPRNKNNNKKGSCSQFRFFLIAVLNLYFRFDI